MNEARNAQAQLAHAGAANACREFFRNGAHYWVALMGASLPPAEAAHEIQLQSGVLP